jgi:hypothetical protein
MNSLYTVTFKDSFGNYQQAEGSFEKVGSARKFAAVIGESFSEVTVWIGQPGGMRA